MDSPQILQFVDETVYTKTGKHLNNLQRRIIAGILNRQRYADVAENYGYSAKHIKKASHELLQRVLGYCDAESRECAVGCQTHLERGHS